MKRESKGERKGGRRKMEREEEMRIKHGKTEGETSEGGGRK